MIQEKGYVARRVRLSPYRRGRSTKNISQQTDIVLYSRNVYQIWDFLF